MEPIVIWGAGGHAKVVAQSLRRTGRWHVHGFIDDVEPQRAGEAFDGATIVGGREALDAVRAAGCTTLALAFGANAARLALGAALTADGWRFPPVVDPHAVVADSAQLGDGCYVAAGAVVQPGASIGAQTIVNTGAIVEHDCRVGVGVHLCPRVCLAGHVEVGGGAWIGAGAVVRDRIRIGSQAFVGVGAVVVADVPEGWLAYGNPARAVREVT